jgi:hypothetical protein
MATDHVQRRILALLDKAASTHFEPEAEAATAKAFELMARHHVDEAVLEARREAQDPSRIIEQRVDLGRGPYVNGRLALLTNVCEAFAVRCLTSVTPDGRAGHVIGHRSDVARVLLLFGSLHAQAASRMAASGPTGNPIRYRRSFLFGFAAKVAERLDQVAEAVRQEASSSTALVLVDRSARVDAWVESTYGRLRLHRAAAPATDGWAAGEAAGEAADLRSSEAVPAPKRALGS